MRGFWAKREKNNATAVAAIHVSLMRDGFGVSTRGVSAFLGFEQRGPDDDDVDDDDDAMMGDDLAFNGEVLKVIEEIGLENNGRW